MEIAMKPSIVIKQIVSADRWFAQTEPGKPNIDIACFALVDGNLVRAVCYVKGQMIFADDLPGFTRIARYEY